MKIEKKILNPNEVILYFSNPLPIIGCLLKEDANAPEFFSSVSQTLSLKKVLLTSDFLYINSPNTATLEDAELILLAEIEDYFLKNAETISASPDHTEEKIELLLELIIAPFLQKDGGNIRFINLKDNIVSVQFLGKCNGCPYANKTLKERVEKNLIRYLPQIKEAVLV